MSPRLLYRALAVSHPLVALIEVVLAPIRSRATRYTYHRALIDFLAWHQAQDTPSLTPAVMEQYRVQLHAHGYGAAGIRQRLGAIGALLHTAVAHQYLDAATVDPLVGSSAIPPTRRRVDKSLSRGQIQSLLDAPDATTLHGLRDRALLAVVVGSGLRPSELVYLTFEPTRAAENVWILVTLKNRYQRVRTVQLPEWVSARLIAWQAAAGITTTGYVFRALLQSGELSEHHLTSQRLHSIVSDYATAMGVAPVTFKELRSAARDAFV